MDHIVPAEWLQEAGLNGFQPRSPSYVCSVDHKVIAIANIELPMRNEGIVKDKDGFDRVRMIAVLTGIRDGSALPPIILWPGTGWPRQWELRDGFHRYYASVALGFTHIPADLIPRY